jgi:hypothetical protein
MSAFASADRDIQLYAQVKLAKKDLSKSRPVVIKYPFDFATVCQAILKSHLGKLDQNVDYRNKFQLLQKSGLKIAPEFMQLLENEQEVILVETQYFGTSTNKRSRSLSGQLFTVRKLFNAVRLSALPNESNWVFCLQQESICLTTKQLFYFLFSGGY